MITYSLRVVTMTAALAISTISAVTSASAAPFDGSWSVLIVTRSGTCDPTFRTSVSVSNGVVSGQGAANVSGRVSNNGSVSVHVSSGGSAASGSGRLRGNSGGGSWAGHGSQGRCSGSWSASRGG
jgi:hypothetical protein